MTFNWPISVYYEDTDAGGVVYHSNYLNFFERARTEWLKALGVSQTALLADDTAFVVKRAELDFKKAARFEQNLIVETKVIELKKASLVFHQRLVDHLGDCYCEGTVLVACVALSRMRPRAIPLNIVQEFDSASWYVVYRVIFTSQFISEIRDVHFTWIVDYVLDGDFATP